MTTPNKPGKVVIGGGKGFLGVSLALHLKQQGWSVVILSRSQSMPTGPWRHVHWDGRTVGPWAQELDGANALINLAGRSVDCIKTPEHVDEILRSRVESTRTLGAALRSISAPPPVWVQMGTAHIYGDPPTEVCTENSALGYGLAPFVAQAWEQAFQESMLPQQRGVILRTGFVLGRDQGYGGGALTKLARVTRWGLGGCVGSGKQGMSWIHEADLNQIFELALVDPAMQGIYIASGPQPVPQAEFMRDLRRTLGVPIGLPATAWMVGIGAPLVLRSDPELALYGRYVLPERLLQHGFTFQFPTLREALNDLFRNPSRGHSQG